MKTFKGGQRVRVEIDGVIVRQSDKHNPYWYDVLLPSGEVQNINISRLSHLADEVKIAMDTDRSIQIISNRLSARGARELLLWLQTHEQDFIDQVEQEADACTQDGEPMRSDKFVTSDVEDIIVKRKGDPQN